VLIVPFLLLTLEFVAFFVIPPLLIFLHLVPNLPIPYLLLAAVGGFLILRRNPAGRSATLFSWRGILPQLVPVLLRDAILLILLGLAVRIFAPEFLFSLVRRQPLFWAMIMLLYPLLSVCPQEFLYRAFFFQRYQPLFGSGRGMIAASSLAFSFVHIIFGNWLAVGLCVLGGLLFSLTYHRSGSLLLASIDHALFGNFIFTIGLGQFFHHGLKL
jgi:membrane protease YdiL (CAAX protease family)